MSAEAEKVGQWHKTLRATAEIQEIAEQVKPELEKKTGRHFLDYYAMTYRSQLVHGKNYLIKVCIKDTTGECVHLMVFYTFPGDGGEMSLSRYQTGKDIEDPLVPFH